jgi:hypothetical protein
MFLKKFPVTIVAVITLSISVLGSPLVGGVETPFHVNPHDTVVRVLVGGDVMLDRTVRSRAEAEGYDYLIEPLLSLMHDHDIVVFNLEGPITDHDSVSLTSVVGEPANTQFTFSPTVATWLAKHDVIAHVGNNHINDFGTEGVRKTIHYAREAGAVLFGDAGTALPTHTMQRVGDLTFGLVSYNQFVGGSFARAVETLTSLRPNVDVLIVYAHWGDEYVAAPRASVRIWAGAFVDAGADLVVASHPHVVGAREHIAGVPVYYSLGNLVFDQYWNDEVRCGALLSVAIDKGKITSTELIPVYLDSNRQTILADDHCAGISYK